MKIYYDNIIFSLQKAGGISIYFYELLKRSNKENITLLETGKENNNIFYQKLLPIKNTIKNNNIFPLKIFRYLDVRINEKNKFIFHSTYYRLCQSKNAINITTVHDFTYERYVKGLPKLIHQWQKRRTILNSDGIICVSENTKKDLLYFIPEASKKNIVVIYNGVGDEFFPILKNNTDLEKELKEKKYILYVGDRAKYKNFDLLLESMSQLKEFKLILIGGKKLTKAEKNKLDELTIEYFQYIGLSGNQLNIIYNYAFCLVYPSTYEGFGIPILEAMKAGCPVIASKVSSIPEVGGDAILYFDNFSKQDLISKINSLKDKNLRENLIQKGFLQSKIFSWDKTYENIQAYYKKLIKIVGES